MTNKKEILKSAIEKVKLVDAGVKQSNTDMPCAVSNAPKDRVYYPSIYLSSKEAPMLIGTDVGSEVTMLIKGKVTSHSLRERDGQDKHEDFNLEIREIGVVETKNKE